MLRSMMVKTNKIYEKEIHEKCQISKVMMVLLMYILAPYHRLSQYKETVLLHRCPRFCPHPASTLLGDLGQATSLL